MQITLFKKIFIIFILLLGTIYALPNFLKYENMHSSLEEYLPSNTINLGLDLQGGSHLVLEVDLDVYLKNKYQNMVSEVRKTLAKERLRYTAMRFTKQGVTFNATKEEQYSEIRKTLVKKLANINIEHDEGKFSIAYTDLEIQNLQTYAIGQTLEILRSRVDQFGVSEPLIQRQGANRIIIELPGVKDSKTAKDLIGKTAQLNFHMVDRVLANNDRRIIHPPVSKIVSYEILATTENGEEIKRYYLLDKRPVLSGENLADARSGFTQEGQSDVSIAFDSKGARQFAKVTTENTGRRLAIVLDGVTYSAPNLNEPILGGRASITGNFTTQEAESLAIVLRAGALPAPVKIVEERTVGPSLGADSIEDSKTAIMIGFAMILGCMILVYGSMGMIANIALVVNVILIIALMSMIGSTLTLPGIAGIVLTMGMAVDANVLIFERIREELKKGKNKLKSLDIGYNSALSTIFDANITTLIAAVVLFAVGSGPIKGFALTLSIGIISSVFTAVMLSRWLLEVTAKYTIKTKEIKKQRTFAINFSGKRHIFAIISTAFVVLSAGFIGFKGLNFGIDFSGGSLIEFKTTQDKNLEEVRAELNDSNLKGFSLQSYGAKNEFLVRISDKISDAHQAEKLIENVDAELRRLEYVGPQIGQELTEKGILATIFSLIAILMYVSFRFQLRFALGAVLALFHDVMLTLGVFVLTGREFSLPVLAAILTIIGYSLNDTIVVYDRIREDMTKTSDEDDANRTLFAKLINTSINSTLRRTLMTSFTTFIVLMSLYLFGGQSINDFAFALIFGVVVGTYSSIFVASPILIYLSHLAPKPQDEKEQETEDFNRFNKYTD